MKDNIIIENKFSYDFNHLKNPRKFGDLLLYQLGEIYCNNSAVVAFTSSSTISFISSNVV